MAEPVFFFQPEVFVSHHACFLPRFIWYNRDDNLQRRLKKEFFFWALRVLV